MGGISEYLGKKKKNGLIVEIVMEKSLSEAAKVDTNSSPKMVEFLSIKK